MATAAINLAITRSRSWENKVKEKEVSLSGLVVLKEKSVGGLMMSCGVRVWSHGLVGLISASVSHNKLTSFLF